MHDRNWLDQLIRDGIEESLTLEYKAAGSLGREPKKKGEVTKDVSAMANSAGGIIVYGVAEFKEKEKRHLPERIDAISRTDHPKEWLEHIIQNIRPRLIPNIVAIDISHGTVVYVVDIPPGETAHQASDKRYYKRMNFESVPMDDYEIRDVMSRNQHPLIELYFQIHEDQTSGPSLEIHARNNGQRFAKYINGFVTIPKFVLHEYHNEHLPSGALTDIYVDNKVQDPTGFSHGSVLGPRRYEPVLPSLSMKLESVGLISRWPAVVRLDESAHIKWVLYADNAPRIEGEKSFIDLSREADSG